MEQTQGVVSNIPSGILICQINESQVNVNSISPDSIEIRMAGELDKGLAGFTLYTYDFEHCTYKTDEFSATGTDKTFAVQSCHKEQFYVTYILNLNGFKPIYDFVVSQYYGYVTAKIEDESINNYPVWDDDKFATSYDEWLGSREDVIKNIQNEAIHACDTYHIEFAVCLDDYDLYEKYVGKSSQRFTDIQQTLIMRADRIYIGNQFCHNLFPDSELLIMLLDKAMAEGKKITVAFTYLRQELIDLTTTQLQTIHDWCCKNNYPVEIVINDYGMLGIMNSNFMTMSLGILLNKRRKDPRMKYKYGNGQSPLNQSNQILFGDFLKQSGITRIEQEACGYELTLDERFKHSMHLPLYQTNTSQYCTLYALCKNHDRSRQCFVRECPRYCERYVCAYPEHLNTIGKYNSLFVLNDTSVIFEKYDRVVWNLL